MTVTFTGSQSTNGKVLIPNTDSTTYTITGTGTCGPVDSDRDGVPDAIDNCPNIANTNQADADLDGLGDLCDPNAFPPSVRKHADPDLVTGPEGYAMTTGGSFDDQDGTSPQITKSDGRGDVSDEGNGNWSWSLTPADEGRGDVTVQADDGQHRASDSFSWRALNVAPTADITNTGPIDEGGTATISLTNVFDPSVDIPLRKSLPLTVLVGRKGRPEAAACNPRPIVKLECSSISMGWGIPASAARR